MNEKQKDDLKLAATREKGIHQELLGLKSKRKDRLGKVAILVDTSGSMEENRQGMIGGESSRWKLTKEVIRVWLEHLAADEVVLIRFASVAEKARVYQVKDAPARKRLGEEIDSWKPSGITATYDALVAAYAVDDLDAIILFTDGNPTEEIDGRNTGKRAIYNLVDGQKARRLPINVVAVGQYFDEGFSTFLLELARLTDGSFQGR